MRCWIIRHGWHSSRHRLPARLRGATCNRNDAGIHRGRTNRSGPHRHCADPQIESEKRLVGILRRYGYRRSDSLGNHILTVSLWLEGWRRWPNPTQETDYRLLDHGWRLIWERFDQIVVRKLLFVELTELSLIQQRTINRVLPVGEVNGHRVIVDIVRVDRQRFWTIQATAEILPLNLCLRLFLPCRVYTIKRFLAELAHICCLELINPDRQELYLFIKLHNHRPVARA